MAGENDVNLKINVDANQATDDLDKFEKDAGDSLSGVEKAFGALKTAAAAAVAIFATAAVANFFAEGVEAANAQAEALARLETQLSQTGELTDEAVKQFTDLADELERTSKFEDDAVISAAALAKSFGITNKQAEQLTRAATELSAVTGESLETSVRKLGKTYSGVTGTLDEQVNSIKGLTKEQLANGAAVQLILDRYGGSAVAQIRTFSGAISQAEKAFGNFQEVFGAIITENPAVLASIGALTEVFNELGEFAEQNSEAISEFVTFGVEAIATSVPLAVDVIGFLTRALEGAVVVGSLAFGTLVDIVTLWGDTFGEIIQVQGDAFLGLLELITRGVSEIPGVSTALGALGVDTEAAAGGIASLRASFNESVDAGQDGIKDFRTGIDEFTNSFVDSAEAFNAGFDEFGQKVDGVVQKIFDADGATVESAKKAGQGRRDALAPGVDPKEYEKARADAKKFAEGVALDAADELEKIQIKRDQDVAQLEKFFKDGALSAEEFAEAEATARRNASDKIAAILEGDTEKYVQELEKRKQALRAQVAEAASNPIKFAVEEIDFKPLSEGLQTSIATAVGALGEILNGKQGAKNLVAEGAGAFADAFIPGIGGAVSGVVGKLAEGPEAVEEFVRGFIAGVPDIITAIAESLPVLVDVLIAELITNGGLVDIGIAIFEGFGAAVEGIFMMLGRQLGIDIGDNLNADEIGKKLTAGFDDAAEQFKSIIDIKGAFSDAWEAISGPIAALWEGDIAGALESAIFGPLEAITNLLPESIREPFTNAIEQLKALPDTIGKGIANAFTNGLPDFGQIFSDAADVFLAPLYALFEGDLGGFVEAAFMGPLDFFSSLLPDYISEPFDEVIGQLTAVFDDADAMFSSISDFFTDVFEDLFEPFELLFAGDIMGAIESLFTPPEWLSDLFVDVPDWLEDLGIDTPDWLQDFIDAVYDITTLGGVFGESEEGEGFFEKIGLAEGGMIPPGFPNDSFPLAGNIYGQSGERVLSEDQNRGLIKLLESIQKQGAAAMGQGRGMAQISIKIGERELAQVLYDLDNSGYRTRA